MGFEKPGIGIPWLWLPAMAMVAGNGCMPWKDQWASISVATSSALIEAG